MKEKMKNKKTVFIDFDEFVKRSGVKKKTVMRRYKKIPGITKTDNGFRVISGTRYPYNIGNTKLRDSYSRRITLLKAISKYKYISHRELQLEPPQFEEMLRDFLSAGLIQCNNLSNTYGANAYDCTRLGDEYVKRQNKSSKEEFIKDHQSAS